DRPDNAGHDARADGVLAEARADLPLLDDLERNRKGAGPEREGQVAGLLDRPAGECNPAAPVDALLNDRRPALDISVEDDRHVVAGMARRLGPELAAAGAVQLEIDHRRVGQRIEL